MESDSRRTAVLDKLIDERLAQGYRLESKNDFQAMVSTGWPRSRFLRTLIVVPANILWAPHCDYAVGA